MGGRVYDYSLGRFLSVDPIIGNPANSQSLNPYSYIGNNPLSGTDPTGYDCQADSKGQIESACLASNDGVNKIIDANGKTVATAIVLNKGDTVSSNLSNGGSFSATFTGKTGDISRLLNGGAPSDIGSIGKMTNSALDGTAASYAFGQDKTAGRITDVMAQQQHAQQMAVSEAYWQWTRAHEGMEGVPMLGIEAIGQAAYGAYNEVRQNGGVSAGTVVGAAAIAVAGVMHVPAAARTAEKDLVEMASDIRQAGVHPASVNQRTIAVGEDAEGNLFAGSSNGFDRGQREAAEKLGIVCVSCKKGAHAEENLMREVPNLRQVGTSKRSPCGAGEHNCRGQLEERGIGIQNDH